MRALILLLLLLVGCEANYYCINGQLYRTYLDGEYELDRLDISDSFTCVKIPTREGK